MQFSLTGFFHYLEQGYREGRDPIQGYHEAAYLAANPDVAAQVHAGNFTSGYEHFAEFGFHEHRGGVDALAYTYIEQQLALAHLTDADI